MSKIIETIQCTKLEIVDADGNPRMILSSDSIGSHIDIFDKSGTRKVRLSAFDNLLSGGKVSVCGSDGSERVSLSVNEDSEHGGGGVVYVNVGGVNPQNPKYDDLRSASLSIGKNGGQVCVTDKFGECPARLGIDQRRGGYVKVWGRDRGRDMSSVQLNGGGVEVKRKRRLEV